MLEQVSVAESPVSVKDAREFCRAFDDTEHDLVFALLIDAAIEEIESETRLDFRSRTWKFTGIDSDLWTFPKSPIVGEIVARDADDYIIDLSNRPGVSINRIADPARLIGAVSNGIESVEWVAGATVIPATFRLLVLQRVEAVYSNRSGPLRESASFLRSLEQQKSGRDGIR